MLLQAHTPKSEPEAECFVGLLLIMIPKGLTAIMRNCLCTSKDLVLWHVASCQRVNLKKVFFYVHCEFKKMES
uniref:Uncharacterized protein n=1 Tax=Anguilla anguilla TaxID=7936 RepID=A0A0E9PQ89_ANGAN